jgi:hypothetical protein
LAPTVWSLPANLENNKVITRQAASHCTLFACCLSLFVAQAPAAEWLGDYASAYWTAQREGKPLLVVFEKPSASSSRLQQISDSSRLTESILLSPYTLCRISVTTEQGRKIAALFGATRFPYVVITDKQQYQIIHRKAGKVSDLDWATMLISHREGSRPKVNLSSLNTAPNTAPGVCYT